MRYQLNLAGDPFPRYRMINVLLSAVLLLIIVFSVWHVSGFLGYAEEVRRLRSVAQQARVNWESMGIELTSVDERLRRPEVMAELEEVRFLNTIIERKRFSWTRFLAEIEELIPGSVYLLALRPEIAESGEILVQMDARGESISAVSQFIRNLESAKAFGDVIVANESRADGGEGIEVVVSMTVRYDPRPGSNP